MKAGGIKGKSGLAQTLAPFPAELLVVLSLCFHVCEIRINPHLTASVLR